MTIEIQVLDVVVIVRDLPKFSLTAGEVGTVVDIISRDVYEVEFCDEEGQTYGMFALHTGDLLPLHRKGRPWK